MALGVGLGHGGEAALRALPGQFEGEPHDPNDPFAGEDGHLHLYLFRMTLMGPPPDAGIFAFRVLADDDPVQVPGTPVAQGAPDTRQDAGGPDVCILIKSLADVQPQSPKGDVIGDGGMTDGAEIDSVKGLQDFQAILRHHPPMGAVIVTTPGKGLKGHPKAPRDLLEGVEDLDLRGDDFQTDPVGGDGSDSVCLHGSLFLRS